MTSEAILQKLQFNREWLDLGIVTPPLLAQLWREYETGADTHTEHYRWRAFQSFLKSQREISASAHRALYRLAEQDPDAHAMGQAMRCALIKRADCPLDLLEKAARASDKPLTQLARRQLQTRRVPQAA